MVTESPHVIEDEVHEDWYRAGPDGFLMATMRLTPSEAARMTGITRERPPERPPVDMTQRDIDEAHAIAIRIIKAESARRAALPISFDGSMVDADAKALAAITARINNPGSGAPFWRDHANVNFEFRSEEELQVWLGLLSAAITARAGEIKQWEWEMKAQQAKLTDKHEIVNFAVAGVPVESL